MKELNIGDVVLITEPESKFHYKYGWAEKMNDYIGKTAIITNKRNDRHILDIDPHVVWSSSNLKLIKYDLF